MGDVEKKRVLEHGRAKNNGPANDAAATLDVLPPDLHAKK